MMAMSRNGTTGRVKVGWSTLLLAASLLGANPALAQNGDQPMDQEDTAQVTCDDGTAFTAVFGESSVDITLADGTKVTLPQQDSTKGFGFTNGKYTLSGDEESIQWAVGKKAPTACQFADQDQPDAPSHFDEPLTVDTAPLPVDKANPDAKPQVNCYRYAAYMVKEVDLGEKGAESLSIAAPDAACERNPGKNETPVKDDIAGYFLGAKGGVVFFQASDGWNGGLPFVAYDTQSKKRLFEDSMEGDDFESLDVNGTKISMTFRRVFSSDCSLYLDGTACADKIKKATGLGEIAPLPDCGAVYEAEKKRTPDYAKEIEQLPSVVSYEAELSFDGTTATIKPLKGKTACGLPS